MECELKREEAAAVGGVGVGCGGSTGFHLLMLGMDGENDEKGGVCVC